MQINIHGAQHLVESFKLSQPSQLKVIVTCRESRIERWIITRPTFWANHYQDHGLVRTLTHAGARHQGACGDCCIWRFFIFLMSTLYFLSSITNANLSTLNFFRGVTYGRSLVLFRSSSNCRQVHRLVCGSECRLLQQRRSTRVAKSSPTTLQPHLQFIFFFCLELLHPKVILTRNWISLVGVLHFSKKPFKIVNFFLYSLKPTFPKSLYPNLARKVWTSPSLSAKEK